MDGYTGNLDRERLEKCTYIDNDGIRKIKQWLHDLAYKEAIEAGDNYKGNRNAKSYRCKITHYLTEEELEFDTMAEAAEYIGANIKSFYYIVGKKGMCKGWLIEKLESNKEKDNE